MALEVRLQMVCKRGLCAGCVVLLEPSGHKWIVKVEGGPRRVNHAAVKVGESIYSFGGFCTGEDYTSLRPIDVSVLDTCTFRWTLVESPNHSWEVLRPNGYILKKDVPFQRYGHTVVAYENDIYLFGGRNDQGACNKLYKFSTTDLKWTLIRATGCIPGARDGHSACVIGNRMYVFGGFEEQADRFSNDVYALDLWTFKWEYVCTQGVPPSHRDFHSACAIYNRMYIFGGRGDMDNPYHSSRDTYCNRLTYLDTETSRWHFARALGDVPTGRRSHSSFVYRGEMYIFGGYDSVKKKHYGTMHCYDPVSERWREIPINVGRTGPPCARRRHASVIVEDRLFVFGGTSPSKPSEGVIGKMPNDEYDDTNPMQEKLVDHNDLYVLDFRPTLVTLCLSKVIEASLNQRDLPISLQLRLRDMVVSNQLSRPIDYAG
ncbi:kelch domain-containing protein 3-like isoform X1 [Varroa jacobsoni]|uniref:Kelch domain-containing protein 3 n=1 Tax=Varroa destructor TaxID=109461 RepID=A0A7M7KB20_VARDE|nr:kelch domain-containing protein 3-like isoform X2 [Varroa destructor]XP_022687662.1 kelch domain-containing protein 3-like isoform X1 [Varroa jacobsoni]